MHNHLNLTENFKNSKWWKEKKKCSSTTNISASISKILKNLKFLKSMSNFFCYVYDIEVLQKKNENEEYHWIWVSFALKTHTITFIVYSFISFEQTFSSISKQKKIKEIEGAVISWVMTL